MYVSLPWLQNPSLKLLDQWLKGISKPFSKFLNHDQQRKVASSINWLPLKVSYEKIVPFLCCHILQVKAIHQICHLWDLTPEGLPKPCWRKWCLGVCGKTPEMFNQDIDSHQTGRILLQLKNKWAASSSLFLQNGQKESLISIFLLRKFDLVGSLSMINLQAKRMLCLESLDSTAH